MEKIYSALLATFLSVLPFVTFAQGAGTGIGSAGWAKSNSFAVILKNVAEFINSILIPAILALAFLVFVWGVFIFYVKGAANEEERKKGTYLITYSIAGFVIVLIFFGVVNLIVTGLGVSGTPTLPTAPTWGG